MSANSSTGPGPIVGINVTPMVDVVLVLLVIMMVSATYIVQQSLKVELPKTVTSDEVATSPAAVTVTRSSLASGLPCAPMQTSTSSSPQTPMLFTEASSTWSTSRRSRA
jgi:hypothetical protein